jgi:hypothetical protein
VVSLMMRAAASCYGQHEHHERRPSSCCGPSLHPHCTILL